MWGLSFYSPLLDCELLHESKPSALPGTEQVAVWESFAKEWTASPWVGGIYWSCPSPSTSLVFVIKAEKQAESNEVDI